VGELVQLAGMSCRHVGREWVHLPDSESGYTCTPSLYKCTHSLYTCHIVRETESVFVYITHSEWTHTAVYVDMWMDSHEYAPSICVHDMYMCINMYDIYNVYVVIHDTYLCMDIRYACNLH